MNGLGGFPLTSAMVRRSLVALVIAGCSAGPTTPADRLPDPTHSTIEDGRFQLTFVVARTTLRPGDAIEGVATLRLLQPGPGALSGSGTGVLAFSFHEVGGAGRTVDPVFTADCVPHRISVERPITSTIIKSGAVSGSEPDAAFKQSFLDDPLVHLPIGTWDITAQAGFVDGANCEGQGHSIRATVRVRVTE
jgi:hypothetical protein